MLGVQGDGQVERLGHYGEIRPARQCAAPHFLVNSCSSANASVPKDLSVKTLEVLQLTIAFAVC